MANVLPGYTFTGTTDPITHTKLNLLGQPTVSIGNDEITSDQIASNITISGLTIAADTPLFGSYSTDTFSATIAMTFGTDKGNTRRIQCTSNTGSTINASSVPAAGYILVITFKTDGTAGNTITFGTNFKDAGNYALNSANTYYQIMFVSDGTYLCEIARSGASS